MIQRITILSVYFVKSVIFSLAGLLLVIFSLIYWAVFFPPGQGTPDVENYIILLGVLGAVVTFMAALSTASKAGRLENYPFMVRLPSRIEYLIAVLLGAISIGLLLQLLVAGLALIRGPNLTTANWLTLPPLWLSLNILAALLAIHATDMVATGWSRVIIFGTLAVLLLLNSSATSSDSWLAARLNDLSLVWTRLNLMWFADITTSVSRWLESSSLDRLGQVASQFFWPFRAMVTGVMNGGFNTSQALAPAVVILYGTILFLIAALLFSSKDLDFFE